MWIYALMGAFAAWIFLSVIVPGIRSRVANRGRYRRLVAVVDVELGLLERNGMPIDGPHGALAADMAWDLWRYWYYANLEDAGMDARHFRSLFHKRSDTLAANRIMPPKLRKELIGRR